MLVRQGVFLNAQSRGMLTLFMRVISSIVWLGRDVCVVSVGSDYDLAKTNAMLEMFQHDDAGYTTIKERELREALGNCVTGDQRESLLVHLYSSPWSSAADILPPSHIFIWHSTVVVCIIGYT